MISYLSLSFASSFNRYVPTSRLTFCVLSSWMVWKRHISWTTTLKSSISWMCQNIRLLFYQLKNLCIKKSRLTSSTDEAIAQATGFPPKVLKCTPLANEAAISGNILMKKFTPSVTFYFKQYGKRRRESKASLLFFFKCKSNIFREKCRNFSRKLQGFKYLQFNYWQNTIATSYLCKLHKEKPDTVPTATNKRTFPGAWNYSYLAINTLDDTDSKGDVRINKMWCWGSRQPIQSVLIYFLKTWLNSIQVLQL